MAAYPETIQIQTFVNDIWEDLTPDVISSQDVQYGITGNSPTDRVASTGTFTFFLRNDAGCLGGVEGYYIPTTSSAKPGWRKGIPVRLRITYLGETFTKFYGHISDMEFDVEGKTARITVADWIEQAATYPVFLPTIIYDKDISEVVEAVVSGMPVQPLNKTYNTGTEEFNTVFDTVRQNTKALSEFNKVALSEFGYIYVKRDKDDGETLVVEGRYTRNAASEVSKVPVFNPGFLLKEDGDYLLLETGNKIILELVQDASVQNKIVSTKASYGKNFVNRITAKSYPRYVDTANAVLFTLNSPISLSASETRSNIKGTFKDPSAGASKVTGKDMVVPASGTDYLMYQNSDGTGTNLTANLTVLANYGAEGVEYTLTNTGATPGYVTKLQARGKGIYLYDPVDYITEDSASVATYGYSDLTLDMKYQDSVVNIVSLADITLSQEKEPRTDIGGFDFIANTDEEMLTNFLYLDIGDLVYIKDDKSGINGYYYIHGIKFKIYQGGIIEFTWNIKEALTLQEVYWQLEIPGYSELGTTTILGY